MAYKPIIGIYSITSPSGKVYVGQSVNIKDRWRRYRRGLCKSQTKLWHSFEKYGVSSHVFEIIIECEAHELNDLERYYINIHQATSQNKGLNLREGGSQNYKMAESTKEKLRRLAIERGSIPPSRLGARHTEEAIEINRQKHIGRTAWNKGIPQTEQQKSEHSKRMKGRAAWNKGLKLI